MPGIIGEMNLDETGLPIVLLVEGERVALPNRREEDMATRNWKAAAMEQLGYGLDALRDPVKSAEITALAESLKAEASSGSGSGGRRVTQAEVANALLTFAGFEADPTVYGPEVREVHAYIVEQDDGREVKQTSVSQHLNKLRHAGLIANASKVSTGKRGQPPKFFYAAPDRDEDLWQDVLDGSKTVK